MGMRNHEFVPLSLIEKISHSKRANAFRLIKILLKHKLVVHTSKNYDGYKLNYLGYDFLAIYTLLRRGILAKVNSQVGIGKESDIFACEDHQGKPLILKLARLGRQSFKTVKNNRDYLEGRTQFNWLYLSRLATTKEFAYMQALHKEGFPTPEPVDCNRHAILMSRIDGLALCKVAKLENPEKVFHQAMDLLVRYTAVNICHAAWSHSW